jgi:hypothetical protein
MVFYAWSMPILQYQLKLQSLLELAAMWFLDNPNVWPYFDYK